MPRKATPLTDGQEPKTGPTSSLTARGSRLWRLKYRHSDRKRLTLGAYPTLILQKARRRDEARQQLADE